MVDGKVSGGRKAGREKEGTLPHVKRIFHLAVCQKICDKEPPAKLEIVHEPAGMEILCGGLKNG